MMNESKAGSSRAATSRDPRAGLKMATRFSIVPRAVAFLAGACSVLFFSAHLVVAQGSGFGFGIKSDLNDCGPIGPGYVPDDPENPHTYFDRVVNRLGDELLEGPPYSTCKPTGSRKTAAISH